MYFDSYFNFLSILLIQSLHPSFVSLVIIINEFMFQSIIALANYCINQLLHQSIIVSINVCINQCLYQSMFFCRELRYFFACLDTVDLWYNVTYGTREICMLYPKIRYKGGRLVVNRRPGTCCFVRYMRQNAISEGVKSEVHYTKGIRGIS